MQTFANVAAPGTGGLRGPLGQAPRARGAPGLACATGARAAAAQVQLSLRGLTATHLHAPHVAQRCGARGCVWTRVGQERAVWAWARRRAPVGRPGSPGDANRRHQSPPNRACPPPSHTHLLPQAYIIALGEKGGGACAAGARAHTRASGHGAAAKAHLTARAPLARTHTHTHTGAGYNSRPPRRVRASGARAHRARERRGAARLYRGRPRPHTSASGHTEPPPKRT